MSHPKFILVSDPSTPLLGTFVYGLVDQHKDLLRAYEKVHGYVKVHGGGWYLKDDVQRTITLYGLSKPYSRRTQRLYVPVYPVLRHSRQPAGAGRRRVDLNILHLPEAGVSEKKYLCIKHEHR